MGRNSSDPLRTFAHELGHIWAGHVKQESMTGRESRAFDRRYVEQSRTKSFSPEHYRQEMEADRVADAYIRNWAEKLDAYTVLTIGHKRRGQ